MTCGGWTIFRKPDEDDMKVFEEAMNGLLGVKYTPLLVKSQIVSGKNYKFICNATPVVPEPEEFSAIVSIFKPLDGAAVLTGISKL